MDYNAGMPLPKDVFQRLVSGDLRISGTSDSDYLDKLPTLDSSIFPDDLRVWDLAASGGEKGKKLHRLLDEAGLTKGQRAGVTHLLDSFVRVGENDLTLGDVRALTEEELTKLRGNLAWGARPSIGSIKKIKKLLG